MRTFKEKVQKRTRVWDTLKTYKTDLNLEPKCYKILLPKCFDKLMMLKLMISPTQVFNSHTLLALAASELRVKGE